MHKKLPKRLFQWSTGRLAMVRLSPDFSLELEPLGQDKKDNYRQTDQH